VFHKFVNQYNLYDAIFWIDTSPEVCIRRANFKLNDPVESKGVDFQRLVRSEYLELSTGNPHFIRIDGDRDFSAVRDDIFRRIKAMI
jgi:thymidylate kinase